MYKNSSILYAPNVHNGGGLTLLKSLLTEWRDDLELLAILDERCKNDIQQLKLANVTVLYWVKTNLISRILSEIKLAKIAHSNKHVFCFHNIPPILCQSSHITIYFQNRLIIEESLKKIVSLKTFFVINLERWIIKNFYRPHMRYITQTDSIRIKLQEWLLKNANVRAEPKSIPFRPPFKDIRQNECTQKKWDFLYISSSEPHKNIYVLLEAWRLLGNQGIKPSLAITIDKKNRKLIETLNIHYSDLNIINLGTLSHEEVMDAYQTTQAFIHPSLIESLPTTLIEAKHFNLPILAPELDYVRDVCAPVETFNPNSSLSISRAVKRFLKINELIIKPLAGDEFWDTILSNSR